MVKRNILSKFKEPQKPIVQDIMNDIISKLESKLEDYILEGLKRKGFEFENKIDLEKFVKTRCLCKDDVEFKERVYYVDNTPFFLHRYEIIYESITEYNNGINMSANYGSYAYL